MLTPFKLVGWFLAIGNVVISVVLSVNGEFAQGAVNGGLGAAVLAVLIADLRA